MFLTGQLHAAPWDEPTSTVLVKDRKYLSDKSWNNPARCCSKVFNFYHKNKLTTQQSLPITPTPPAAPSSHEVLSNRNLSRQRTHNRQIERSALQARSGQVRSLKAQQYSSVLQMDPSLSRELAMRRTKTFKDPAKTPVIQTACSFNDKLDSLPTHSLNMLLTPLIVKNEEEAVSRIANRILSEESTLQEMETQWRTKQRAQLRRLFLNRQKAIDELYVKAGLGKPGHVSVAEPRVSQEQSINAETIAISIPASREGTRPVTSGALIPGRSVSLAAGQSCSMGGGTHMQHLTQKKPSGAQRSFQMLFKHAEFSGLLKAKHPDALRNCSHFTANESLDYFQENRNRKPQQRSSCASASVSKSVKNVFPIPRSAVGGPRLDSMIKRLDLRSSSTIEHKLASAKTSLQQTTTAPKTASLALPMGGISSFSRFTRAITPLAGHSKISVQNVSNLETDVQEAYGCTVVEAEEDNSAAFSATQRFFSPQAEETFNLLQTFEAVKQDEMARNHQRGYCRHEYLKSMEEKPFRRTLKLHPPHSSTLSLMDSNLGTSRVSLRSSKAPRSVRTEVTGSRKGGEGSSSRHVRARTSGALPKAGL